MRSWMGRVWVWGGRVPGNASTMGWSCHEAQQVVDSVGLGRRFVSPYAIDAREAHGEPRLVAGRAREAARGGFPHQGGGGLPPPAATAGRGVPPPPFAPRHRSSGYTRIDPVAAARRPPAP